MEPVTNMVDFMSGIEKFSNIDKSLREVVICRYNEDIAWSESIKNIRTIYDKGSPYNADSIQQPNFGVNQETILWHIINRYDSLAEVTFFTQAVICDRDDQPVYSLNDYLSIDGNGYLAFDKKLTKAWDCFKIEYFYRDNHMPDKGASIHTLFSFSKYVLGLSSDFNERFYNDGSYFSVGAERIRSKPLSYYQHIYNECNFGRGNSSVHLNGSTVEEIFFLEKMFWSIFNLTPDFGSNIPKIF